MVLDWTHGPVRTIADTRSAGTGVHFRTCAVHARKNQLQKKKQQKIQNLIAPQTNTLNTACPGLAQLVERLTHGYSESASSNHGNLASSTVCGDRTGSKPAAKRSVAPEVDLRECMCSGSLL